VLLVLDAWPLRRWSWSRAFALVAEKAPMLALAAVFARIARFAQSGGALDTVASWSDHTLHERIAQAGYGLAYYPAKTLVPTHLLPLYELPHEMSLGEPRWLVPMLAVIAVSAAAIALRKRVPALLPAWGAFALVVAPVLGFSQSGPQLVADRYSYLSCVSLTLLAGAGAALAMLRWPRVAVPLALAAFGALAVATWRQAAVWSTPRNLWERAVELDPARPDNLMSLGALRSSQALAERDPARAVELLDQALDLHTRALKLSDDPRILRNLAQVHTALVRADPQHAQQHRLAALEFSRQALELAVARNKAEPEYRFDYGTDLINLGRFDEGLPHLRAYVAERPDRLLGWINLGCGLVMSGKADEGLRCLERACQLEPNDVRPWETLAATHEHLKRNADALAAWRRVLAIEPRHPTARQRIAALGG
jgi:Tfp pilus assembly protein PilF